MLIKFTYVDAITGVPMNESPCANGPALPTGASIDFSNESQWPCDYPIFYGHGEIAPGVIDVLTQADYDSALASETDRRGKILTQRIVQSAQRRLDEFAATRNYDGIMSACTYATSSVQKFANEGQYAVRARDSAWATLYTIMTEVQSGARQVPTVEEVIAELPALEWPEQ